MAGERPNRFRLKRIRETISADPAVEKVGELLTMQLGPEQALLTVGVQFRRGLDIEQLESAITQIKARIRQQGPAIVSIFIEPERLDPPHKTSSKAA